MTQNKGFGNQTEKKGFVKFDTTNNTGNDCSSITSIEQAVNYPVIDKQQALEQLRLLNYQDGDKVFLRAFYPRGHKKAASDKSVRRRECFFPNLPWNEITDWQREERGVYFVVNGQGNKDADIQFGRAIFYEHDDLPKDISKDLWVNLGLPEPTLQVDTGGKSIHSYWVFDSQLDDIKAWKKLQVDLIKFSAADKQIINESRVMRLAGCWHINKDGTPSGQSKIIENKGYNYEYTLLRNFVYSKDKENPVSDVELAISCLPSLSHMADDYGSSLAPGWLQVGMALHSVDDSLLVDWDEWSKQSQKYEPGVCERKWETFKSSGYGLGSLIHWAREKGWKGCSKQARNSNRANKAGDNFYEVTTTVEDTVFNTTFESGKGDWATFKSAFHKYDKDSGYWQLQDDEKVSKLVGEELRKCRKWDEKSGGYKYIFFKDVNHKSVFNVCRKTLANTNTVANDHLIAFRNGTYNIRTGKLEAHNKLNYLSWAIDANYTHQNDCPKDFEQFICKCFGIEYLELFQALISMYLDPSAPYGYFAHIIGDSGTGKGTFIRFLSSLFQESSVRSIAHFSELQSAEARHQHLTGVKLCACPDSKAFQGNMTAFYELVDNGSYSGRALYSSDGYQKKWNVRFILASTQTLAIENAGDGWNRRCISIPTLPRLGMLDHTLDEKLSACKAQVISWALSLEPSKRNQIIKTACNLEPIAQLKRQQEIFADPVKAFIDKCLHPDTAAIPLTTSELFDKFKIYAQYAGHKPKSLTTFSKEFEVTMRQFKTGGEHKWDKEKKKSVKTTVLWVNISFNNELFNDYDIDALNSNKLREGGLEEFQNPHLITPSQKSSPYDQKDEVMAESTTVQHFQENLTSSPYETSKSLKVKNDDNENGCNSDKENDKNIKKGVLVGSWGDEVRNFENASTTSTSAITSSKKGCGDEIERCGDEVMNFENKQYSCTDATLTSSIATSEDSLPVDKPGLPLVNNEPEVLEPIIGF